MSLLDKQKVCLDIAPNYSRLAALKPELFNAARMLIMQDLYAHGNVDFRDLKANMLGITDGNLAGHLRLLEKAKLIQMRKGIVGRKVRTSYEITKDGREAFEKFRDELRIFVKVSDMIYG